MLGEQFAPHGFYAGYVGTHGGFVAQCQCTYIRQVRLNVHGASAAHAGKTAVHFSTDAAGAGALGYALWPEFFSWEFLCCVLGNGQRVPHHQTIGQAIVHQAGHPASGGHRVDSLLEF